MSGCLRFRHRGLICNPCRASKSNNFYLSLLLTMLFLCVLPVGYAIVWLRPSWHCGPFSEYNRIAEFITNTTRNALPK